MIEPNLSEPQLGHFWPKGIRSSEAWAGVLEMREFPELEIVSLERKRFECADGVVYGVLSSTRVATLFECVPMPSKRGWHNGGVRIDEEDIPARQSGIKILSNFLCVGSSTVDDGACVSRVSFCSRIAEDAFVLWRRKKTRNGSNKWASVASRYCHAKGLRLRIQRQTLTEGANEPGCRIILSFISPVTPKAAYSNMLKVRTFISLVCGEYIDLFDTKFGYKKGGKSHSADFYFYNPALKQSAFEQRHHAALALTSDQALMRKVTDAWLHQTEQQEIASRIFVEILKEEGVIHLNHIKDLVTCIEMITSEKTRPLGDAMFEDLRHRLELIFDKFIEAHADCRNELAEVKERLKNLNTINAKPKILKAIEVLGNSTSTKQIEDVDTFVANAVGIRNRATHDPSRLTAEDYNKLHWLAVKLKMLVAINLWKGLSVVDGEISELCPIIFQAEAFGNEPPDTRR